MSSLMETVRALRHRHDFRGDVFLSATVTGVPRAGINDPLRQISNDSNMRTAMENKDPRCLSCGEQEVNMTCAEQLAGRSEEHTSELQSQFHLVCRLLLEK